jgi:hypothetical protein
MKSSTLSHRLHAFEVTLLGLAGGEFLPLPRSKGAAFPSCSPAMGSPPLPLMSLKDKMLSQKSGNSTLQKLSCPDWVCCLLKTPGDLFFGM